MLDEIVAVRFDRAMISRAKSLTIVIANPALMAIRCQTPEQMALVNTLCWMAESWAHAVVPQWSKCRRQPTFRRTAQRHRPIHTW